MEKLSEKEEKILKYLEEQIDINGYPPTVRDICASLGIKSTSTVHKALEALERAGYIEKGRGKRRALKLLTKEAFEEKSRFEGEGFSEEIVQVPLVGRVAAGAPILAEQNIEDYFPVPSRFTGNGTNFMLKVHGDSMVEAGILDGDYILVNSNAHAENGEIVVACVEGVTSEATVKAFYKEKGHIRLQPRNSSMDPIIVSDCTVLGIVKGVFRYLN